MEQTISILSKAIEDLKILKVADINLEETHLTVLCRINKGSDPIWIEQMKKLLMLASDEALNLICSKRYIVKGNKIVFAWCLEIIDTNLNDAVLKVASFLPKIKKSKGIIYEAKTEARNKTTDGEIEILGAPAQRNMRLVKQTPIPNDMAKGYR